jgi:hypothetical protein
MSIGAQVCILQTQLIRSLVETSEFPINDTGQLVLEFTN